MSTTVERVDDALAERVASAFTLDPSRSTIVMFLGTKGTGKSTGARQAFDRWPAHRMVIDPTGNARPDDPTTIPFTAPFPSQMPEVRDDEGRLLRFTGWARTNPRSSTYTHDLNAAIDMATYPKRWHKLLWIDEYGIGTNNQQLQAGSEADRNMLMSSRHYNLSLLLCLPRPRYINPMALMQADTVVVHQLPKPGDRQLVADNAGVPFDVFERTYHANRKRGKHAFLVFHRHEKGDVLLDCPPLPNVVARGPRA